MGVFLMVLKIIGIVLLSIIGFLLLLILLILFWPAKYTIKVKKFEEFKSKVRISWFFGVVTVVYRCDSAHNDLKVRVLGIPIYKRDFLEDIPEEQKEEPKTSDTDTTEKAPDSKGSKELTEDLKEELTEDLTAEELAEEEIIDNLSLSGRWKHFIKLIIQFFIKIKNKCDKIRYTSKMIYDKIKALIATVQYYYKVYNWPGTKRAYTLFKKELLRLCKHMKPVKFVSEFEYGTGDPASTAQTYGYYCMAYPWIGKNVHVKLDMENKVFTNHTNIRGYFMIFVLLRVFWKLYFNKDIRKLIRLVKREGKKNGRE